MDFWAAARSRTGRFGESFNEMEINMLRKGLLLTLAVVLASTSAMAQRPAIEFTPEANYLWTSRISATIPDGSGGLRTGDIDIKDSGAYGFTVDIEVRPGTQLEFLYLRQDSDLTFKPFTGPEETLIEGVATSYYHVGALQGFKRGNVLPFTGLTLGATQFSSDNSEWKFSFGFNAGAKVYLNERIGLRLHGRVLASMLDTSAGIWAGTGGVGLTVGGSALWQWDLGGGLVIRL